MTDDSKTAADPVAAHNQRAWDAQVREGNRWTLPVDAAAVARARSGSVDIVLARPPREPALRPLHRDMRAEALSGLTVPRK